ncbi:MAG: fibrobacter succinogenes major paralogous domain-containing protein [Prolixibacteraceae bacterium]
MKTLKMFFFALSVSLLINSCGNSSGPATKGKVSDVDGNVYPTVTIGTQTWMAENLKTTKYNDGKPIPNVTDEVAWKELKTDAFCWFLNDSTNKATYGAYYNWNTVNTGKLCPTGWHAPSDKEWRLLTDYLGSENIAGRALKATSGWSKNGVGTDESGFSALPLGYRNAKGLFSSQGISTYWWSTTSDGVNSWYTVLFSKDGTAFKYYGQKESGFSVRCLKN